MLAWLSLQYCTCGTVVEGSNKAGSLDLASHTGFLAIAQQERPSSSACIEYHVYALKTGGRTVMYGHEWRREFIQPFKFKSIRALYRNGDGFGKGSTVHGFHSSWKEFLDRHLSCPRS